VVEYDQKNDLQVIKVKVSDQPDLCIPASLCQQLDLVDDDQVEVVQSGHTITLRKRRTLSPPKSLRELAGLIKSSRPTASVDVGSFMTKRGYEYLHGRQDS